MPDEWSSEQLLANNVLEKDDDGSCDQRLLLRRE